MRSWEPLFFEYLQKRLQTGTPSISPVFTLTYRGIPSLFKVTQKNFQYSRSSLFGDFFICEFMHIGKNYFLVKNGLFICEFKIISQKLQNISTANIEGNLYSDRCWSIKFLFSKSFHRKLSAKKVIHVCQLDRITCNCNQLCLEL